MDCCEAVHRVGSKCFLGHGKYSLRYVPIVLANLSGHVIRQKVESGWNIFQLQVDYLVVKDILQASEFSLQNGGARGHFPYHMQNHLRIGLDKHRLRLLGFQGLQDEADRLKLLEIDVLQMFLCREYASGRGRSQN